MLPTCCGQLHPLVTGVSFCVAQHCCNHQHLAILVHRLPQSALLLSLQELCHQQGDESWGYQMLVSPKGRALL